MPERQLNRRGNMMARANPTFALRPYLPQDAPMLAEIFRASVEELTEDDYNPAQQVPGPPWPTTWKPLPPASAST